MEKMKGRVYALNIGKKKGEPKRPVPEMTLRENYGVVGDVHAGLAEERQVSILAWERIQKKNFCLKKSGVDLKPGDFAENITTSGLNLTRLTVGMKMRIGPVLLEVSKIGKQCHTYCEIYRKIGSCLMPKEGIFARVLAGGRIQVGDEIEIQENEYEKVP